MSPAERLIDLCLGPARSQCVYLFARLGLAEHLSLGPTDHRNLAATVGVQAEPLYRLLRALATLDVVTETTPGVFALSTLGEPLATSAADSVQAHVLHMNEEMYVAWGFAAYSLETGKSAFGQVFGLEYFDWLAKHPEKESIAHRAMNDTQRSINATVALAFDFSQVKLVCDVGGGHGALLSAILMNYPKVNGILFDLPSGLDIALSGVGGPLPRCEFKAGDFFAEVPSGADVYLLKLVLHDWDDVAAEKILTRCRQAMHSEARLLVVESLRPVWPDTSVANLWDFHMLVNTGGRERNLSDIQALMKCAGLHQLKHQLLDNQFTLIELAGEA